MSCNSKGGNHSHHLLISDVLPTIGCVCPHEVSKAVRRLYEIENEFEGNFCKDFSEDFGRNASEVILVRRMDVYGYLEELDRRDG